MAGFWSDFGNAYGNYLGSQSPLAAAAYQGVTGHAPDAQQGQNPATAIANSLIARYKKGSDQSSGNLMTGPNPTSAELSQPLAPMNTPSAPPIDPKGGDQSNPAAASESQWRQDDEDTGKNGGLFGSILNQKSGHGGGDSESTDVGALGGDAALEGLALMAHGGFASKSMMAKIAESGPEFAGGRIVTKPSIVKLNKGESVIPLTPRATNKLQPDLLIGHVATPQPSGVHYSRYRAYGQGRGLMR